MGMVAAGLMLVGGAAEASGAYYEGKAAESASKYNARVAINAARAQAEKVRNDAARVRGENIVRVAKSGVRMEGSPLSVLARNAFESEKQALSYIRAGQAQRDLSLMAGKDAMAAARSNMNTSLLKTGANLGQVDSGGLFNRSATPKAAAPQSTPSGLYKPDFKWNGGY